MANDLGFSTAPSIQTPVDTNNQVFGIKPFSGAKLSSLLPATATNTIDNTNYAQVWNWSTISSGIPLTLSSPSLTSGSLLNLSSTSNSLSGGKVLNINLSQTTSANNSTNYGAKVATSITNNLNSSTSSSYAGHFSNSINLAGTGQNYVGAGIYSEMVGSILSNGATSPTYGGYFTNTITAPASPSYGIYVSSVGGTNSSNPSYGGYFIHTNPTNGCLSVGVRGIANGNASASINTAGWFTAQGGNGASTGVKGESLSTGVNTAGYFNSANGTANYGVIVPSGGGNSGFGTTTPTATLQVSGSTLLQGLTATTISATTYQNLPALSGNYLPLSGGTVTGTTTFNALTSFRGNGGRPVDWGDSSALGALTFQSGVPVVAGITSNLYLAGNSNVGVTVAGQSVYIGGAAQPNSNLHINGSLAVAYVAKSANYNIGASDYTIDCTANSFSVTLPTAVGITGRVYVIKNSGAGIITANTTSSQTIDGSLTYILNQNDAVTVESDNANWKVVNKTFSVLPVDAFYTEPSPASSFTWNVSGQSSNYQVTLTATTTTMNLSGVRNGDYGTIILTQGSGGSKAITLGTVNGSAGTHKVIGGGGGVVTLSTTASAIDALSFVYNGSFVLWNYGLNYT